MSISTQEQETIINIPRNSDKAFIYCSDSSLIAKFDKKVANPDLPEWKCANVINNQKGEIVAKEYEVSKNLISYRGATIHRELTDGQRADLAKRMHNIQELRKANIGKDDNKTN